MRHTSPTTHEGFSHHQCQLIPLHLGSRKKWTNAGCHQRWLKQEGQWQKATCIFFKAETRTKGEVRFPELEDVNMNIPISIFGAGREKTTLMFGLVVWGKNSDATVVIQIRKLKKEKERTVCNVDMDLSVLEKDPWRRCVRRRVCLLTYDAYVSCDDLDVVACVGWGVLMCWVPLSDWGRGQWDHGYGDFYGLKATPWTPPTKFNW